MDTAERIAKLEADLKRLDEQIKELEEELRLVDAMREQVKDSGEELEHVIDTFDALRAGRHHGPEGIAGRNQDDLLSSEAISKCSMVGLWICVGISALIILGLGFGDVTR